MANTALLQIEVVARQGRLWHGVGTHVQVPAVDGSLGILPRRQPLLAALSEGTVHIDVQAGEAVTIDVNRGFVSVDSDYVTVVVDRGNVA